MKKYIAEALNLLLNPSRLLQKHITFLLFIVFLLMIYIHNSYRVQRKAMHLKKERQRLYELKTEYMTLNAKVGKHKKLSEVLRKLSPYGLKLLKKPPYRLKSYETSSR